MTIERRGPPLDPEDLQSQDTASPQDSNEGDDAKAPSQGGDEPESDDSSGESEEVDDLNGAGRVVLSGENVDFAVKVPPDDKVEKAVVVVAPDDGGDVKELTWLGFSTQGALGVTEATWTSTLASNKIDPNYHGQMMFTVLHGTFGDFSLGVFSITDAERKDEVEAQLRTAVEKDSELEGGPSTGHSPWEVGFDASEDARPTPGAGNRTFGAPDSDDDGNDDGLTVGAKAGIGVGVSVGVLLLIGLAVFLFLRRRRRRRRATTSAKALAPASDYMRDKEIPAARVAESPASDDARDSAAFAAAEPPAGRGSAVATPTSTNREVPHSVAHLVEDGMTEDQIRRLEEEERALDQAIEQAGRR